MVERIGVLRRGGLVEGVEGREGVARRIGEEVRIVRLDMIFLRPSLEESSFGSKALVKGIFLVRTHGRGEESRSLKNLGGHVALGRSGHPVAKWGEPMVPRVREQDWPS